MVEIIRVLNCSVPLFGTMDTTGRQREEAPKHSTRRAPPPSGSSLINLPNSFLHLSKPHERASPPIRREENSGLYGPDWNLRSTSGPRFGDALLSQAADGRNGDSLPSFSIRSIRACLTVMNWFLLLNPELSLIAVSVDETSTARLATGCTAPRPHRGKLKGVNPSGDRRQET